MAKRTDKIAEDPQMAEAYQRFATEISNKTYALAYLAVKDCIGQKEYCKRIGVNESRFCRVLNKIMGVPVKHRPIKKKSAKVAVATA